MLALALALSLAGTGTPQLASAALIGTQSALHSEAHEQTQKERLARIDSVLAREDVRAQFIALGVDPEDARARVAALSESELQQLDAHLSALPAGGISALAVVGVIFLVLVLLQLVGAIHLFR